MESLRLLYAIVSGAAGAVGVMLVVVDGAWGAPPTMRQALGCVLLMVAMCSALILPIVGHHRDSEESFLAGYDAGYVKGRRVGKPKVVPLRKQHPNTGA